MTARLIDDLGLVPEVVTGSFFLGLGNGDERYVLTVQDSGQDDLEGELLVSGT